jgi:hypothetical protein
VIFAYNRGMTAVIAVAFVLLVLGAVAAWLALVVRGKLPLWAIVLSIALVVLLFVSFFRVG